MFKHFKLFLAFFVMGWGRKYQVLKLEKTLSFLVGPWANVALCASTGPWADGPTNLSANRPVPSGRKITKMYQMTC